MKNGKVGILTSGLAIALLLAFSGCTSENPQDVSEPTGTAEQFETAEQAETAETDEKALYGAEAAENDEDLTVEDMLNYAIQDEFLARKEYEMIMGRFGEQRPFSNIIQSEGEHIARLEELFETYGFEIPEDKAVDYVVVPETLNECFEVGVNAEIKNISMYERFLEEDVPDDVRIVFEALKSASQNHLEAFERNTM